MAKTGEQPPKVRVSLRACKEKSTSSEGWVHLGFGFGLSFFRNISRLEINPARVKRNAFCFVFAVFYCYVLRVLTLAG